VLELGEDEGGAGYLGGAVGVGGDVLEGGPALGEQGEPALAVAAQAAQQCVPGAGIDVGFLVADGLFHGNEDSDSRAFVTAVGQAGHSPGGGAVEAPGFYGATKTAVNAITASLRRELENDTIRVVTVIPGRTATNLARHQPEILRSLAASFGQDIEPPSEGLFPEEALDRAAVAAGPLLASSDDVARAVLFAVTQPIELSISEISVQPARWLAVPA